MSIGETIKQLRRHNNMTLEELGRRLHVTRQTVCRYESGVIQVPSDKVEEMANIFNVSPAEIMGWDKKPAAALDKELVSILYRLDDEQQQKVKEYAEHLLTESQK
jgi:transcriptional regulator with XRE-family HTH domain